MKTLTSIFFLCLIFVSQVSNSHAETLSADAAAKLIQLSLDCIDQEYPNKTGAVYESERDLKTPKQLHPTFYGCFDWHSAVHGHWALVRFVRLFPNHTLTPKIIERLSQRFTDEKIKKEVARFDDKTFERPYGYAWYLRLVSEVSLLQIEPAKSWRQALQPLEKLLVERTKTYLKLFNIPTRVGAHPNTAFALNHIFDYATLVHDSDLQNAIRQSARKLYFTDQNCPTQYEPSSGDFISPCLAEAELMGRVLDEKEFQTWLTKFIPGTGGKFLEPSFPSDPKDPIVGHLIGLHFQKAWAIESILKKIKKQDPRRVAWVKAQKTLIDASLKLMSESGYGGAHWLASFAIYALTEK